MLVSCAGTRPRPGLDAFESERFQRVRRAGEGALRQSGLGYVIVRPAALVDEPGGYKALLFDQVCCASLCQLLDGSACTVC